MTIYHCNKIWLAILLMILSGRIFAQSSTEKYFVKTVGTTTEQQVNILNEWGDIHVIGWHKDSIRVEIKVGSKEENTNLDGIKPIVSQSPKALTVSVSIDKPSESWLSGWISKNIYDGDKANIEIEYIVYLPSKMTLDINSEFGKVLLEDWNGNLLIQQEHGSLYIDGRIEEIRGSMKFVDAFISQAKRIDLDLKQVELKADSVQHLSLRSAGGQFQFKSVGIINLQSARDKVDIQVLNTGVIESNFSDFSISKLVGKLDVKLGFGSLAIDGFEEYIPALNIDQRSSDVSIYVGSQSFEFMGELDGGSLKLPLATKIIKSKDLDDKGKKKSIHAKYGLNPAHIIRLYSKNGNVIFKK